MKNLTETNKEVLSLVQEVWRQPELWKKNYRKALVILRPFIEQGTHDVITLTNYGTLLSDTGRHKEANSPLQKAIEFGSQDRNTFFNLAVVLVNLRKEEEALRLFEQAQTMEKAPQTWEAYFDPHGH